MYVQVPLSLRNFEALLHERGIEISNETERYWWNRRKRLQQLRAISRFDDEKWPCHVFGVCEDCRDLPRSMPRYSTTSIRIVVYLDVNISSTNAPPHLPSGGVSARQKEQSYWPSWDWFELVRQHTEDGPFTGDWYRGSRNASLLSPELPRSL